MCSLLRSEDLKAQEIYKLVSIFETPHWYIYKICFSSITIPEKHIMWIYLQQRKQKLL